MMAVATEESEPSRGWEVAVEWLRALPPEHVLETKDLDKWLEENQNELSQELKVTPRSEIFARLEAELRSLKMELQEGEPSASQAKKSEVIRKKGRRNGKPITEKWRPVYVWLESLNQREVVKALEIGEWLDAHPEVRQRLSLSHTNEHIFNYIQKCHTRMIVDPRARSHNVKLDKEKQVAPVILPEGRLKRSHKKMVATETPKVGPQPNIVKRIRNRRWGAFRSEASGSTGVRPARSEVLASNNRGILDRGKQVVHELKDSESSDLVEVHLGMDRTAAQKRFELLADLHKELVDILENFKDPPKERSARVDNLPEASLQSQAGSSGTRSRDPVAVFAWSFSEASPGMDPGLPATHPRSKFNERSRANSSEVTSNTDKETASIFKCLAEREMGGNSGTVAFRPHDIGSHGRQWTSFVEGWKSLDKQFKGPVSWLQQQAYCSWSASWCAYTSSVALAPLGGVDQGVQKVLDLRLHPGGLPQLVCSCNAAPNELLLYNLTSGRARELPGHNCQIQAVEYALNGERIISCGTNILKVWDSASGTCLHTMGPTDNEGTSGHRKKISAMAVHQLQSCMHSTNTSRKLYHLMQRFECVNDVKQLVLFAALTLTRPLSVKVLVLNCQPFFWRN